MMRARGLLLGGACFVALAGLTVAASAAVARPGSTLEHASAFAFVRAPGSFGGGTSTLGSKVPLVPTQTVTGVSPNAGASGPGGEQAVTINGSGFTGATDVFFGATAVSSTAYPCPSSPGGCFTVMNDTTINADTPAEAAGTVDVTVDSGTVNPPGDQYSFFDPPTVTSVPSASQHQGATGIVVAGTNFSYPGVTPLTSGDSEVDLVPTGTGSTVPLTTACSTGTPPDCFAFVDDTHLTIDLPASMPAGQYDTEVITPGGTSATSSNDLLGVLPPDPTLTSLTPSSGSTLGGNNVVLAGTNFMGATDVTFGPTDINTVCGTGTCFSIDSDTQITVHSVPAHAAGSVNVTVTTPSGISEIQSYTYVLPPPPTLTGLNPTSGSINGGNSVVLTGTNFAGATHVSVGSSDLGPCPSAPCFTFDNDTQITVTMPPNPPGPVSVNLTTPEGTTGNLSYAYAVVPGVAAVSPKFGAASGGAFVTVLGSDFGNPSQGFGATGVMFGTKDVTSTTFPCPGSADGCFEQIGTTQLDVYTPAVAASTVDIKVITPGGNSTPSPPADQYTFVAKGAYSALNPFRICDTRPPVGGIAANQCDAAGKGTLVSGRETITVQITGAQVPSAAQAVVANISAINHGSGSTFITAFPAGGSKPLASTINLAGGKVESNLAIVQLSGGQITLFNSVGNADVIVDVEGYFSTPTGASAGAFHSIPPLRICDSRAVPGNTTLCARATGSTSAPLIGGTWRRVVLSGVPPGSSATGIPTTNGVAAAAVFNLTGTAGSAPTYLSVTAPTVSDACPTKAPAFANLNPTPGISLGNRVMSKLGPHQDICLFSAAGSMNFVIDVNGWFGSGTAPPGAFFYSVPPTRICDTRPSDGTRCQGQQLTANHSQLVAVAGVVAVPAWNSNAPRPLAVVANLTGIAGSGATYLTLYPADVTPHPTASDLNPSAGEVIGDLAITSLAQTTGSSVGNDDLYNAVGTINAVLDVAGWFQ